MSWAYCLPTGIAGYQILHRSPATDNMAVTGGSSLRHEIVQGEARGWGMLFTYFYVVYFTVLLVHREMRDEEKCKRKYGEDWEEYTKRVPWRLLPGIY